MSRTPARSPKAGRPPKPVQVSAQAKRRAPSAKAAIRRDGVIVQTAAARRVEFHVAPPRYIERHRSKPGTGGKRARAAMSRGPRRKAADTE